MKIVLAFFSLVRWKNLLFILLTQLLYFFCIYQPIFHQAISPKLFFLITSSVLIAAAGYIINDYFDLNIDQVNKPSGNVFITTIHRRWAILLHFLLSLTGLVSSAIALGIRQWYLVAANFACVILLWVYSTSLKRKVLIGNFVISLLTSWTVLLLFFAYTDPADAISGSRSIASLFRVSFLYAGFAFIISLIREAIKDVEDMEGDLRYHCRTLPIVAGLKATKIYLLVWTIILIAALGILQLYVLQFGWYISVVYIIICIIFPLIFLARGVKGASSKDEFSKLSGLSKVIMLTGILSMIFFKIYR